MGFAQENAFTPARATAGLTLHVQNQSRCRRFSNDSPFGGDASGASDDQSKNNDDARGPTANPIPCQRKQDRPGERQTVQKNRVGLKTCSQIETQEKGSADEDKLQTGAIALGTRAGEVQSRRGTA